MRQVLFRIPVLSPLDLGPLGQWPLFGLGILTLAWLAVVIAWFIQRRRAGNWTADDTGSAIFGLVIAGVLFALPSLLPRFAPDLAKAGLPIYGYGVMLFLAILAALAVTTPAAKKAGYPPDTLIDLIVWLVVPGIVGGRIFYLMRYSEQTFAGTSGFSALFAAINLSNGGLVLQGALLGGAAGLAAFCVYRKLDFWKLADLIIPAVFVGIAIGRIGCLLNGCCFGGPCDLPWAIQFPKDSVPYDAYVFKGVIPPDAPASPPLHPTQIYSTIDGLVLAGVLALYRPYRRRDGDVLGLAMVLSGITRFLIEILRQDEVGLLGSAFTGGQWISIALFIGGIAILAWPAGWPRKTQSVTTPA